MHCGLSFRSPVVGTFARCLMLGRSRRMVVLSYDLDPNDHHLASQPTLSRWESGVGPKTCYLVGRALLESYCKRHPKRPKRVVLDIDLPDDATHGSRS
jgi:DDE family transposase